MTFDIYYSNLLLLIFHWLLPTSFFVFCLFFIFCFSFPFWMRNIINQRGLQFECMLIYLNVNVCLALIPNFLLCTFVKFFPDYYLYFLDIIMIEFVAFCFCHRTHTHSWYSNIFIFNIKSASAILLTCVLVITTEC